MLWRNHNTIVVGRNQNTLSEINPEFVKKNDINVVRRISVGGAVFHDLGNINFTFIKVSEHAKKMIFPPIPGRSLSISINCLYWPGLTAAMT